ncbi:MAG: FAD-dependent oxidoreductase [Chloroflexi bacterium]|nr:FAD-dependent oxidoreductase [Chloroflexota bacterium]
MYTKLESDVVIIGGGLAGLNAAIAAAERGARVVIIEKGKIERSGCIAGGVDHFMAYLEEGEPWDTRDAYLTFVQEQGRGAVDIEIHERVYCDELPEAIKRMERIGNPLTHKNTGKFYRTRSFGAPGPYMINFDGKFLKPRLAKAVRQLGCTVLDRVAATKVFVKNGRVAGVTGINVRDGSFYYIAARAVIGSTGNTNRLYETPTGMPFNNWLCPYNNGAAQVLGFEAGAILTGMEYVRMTIVPKGFSAPGLNAFTGMGASFVNSLGERYMEKYHPLQDRAPRNVLVHAALTEIKEGRAPLFMDCTQLSEEQLEHLKKTLSLDKDTLPDYFQQKNIDIAKEPLEIMVSEGMQTGPLEVVGAGIKIDMNSMSSVPGLFAAGDCADQTKTVHLCICGGYSAGKGAQAYAAGNAADHLGESEILEEKERVLAPLSRAGGVHYREMEDVLRKIMAENVGPVRTEKGLTTAQQKLRGLRPYVEQLKARDYHELMRCLEAKDLLTVGEMVTAAALYRQESRFIPYHYRLDYPATDNEKWCGQVLLQHKDGEFHTSFHPLYEGTRP